MTYKILRNANMSPKNFRSILITNTMILLGQVYRSNELDTARHDQRQEAGIIKSPFPDENHRPES
jgi:hypothetical protein